jgi:hypothetical protein
MDSGGMVFKVAVFALIGLSLYYFYKWLNGSGELTDVILYTSPSDGLPGMATKPTVFVPENSDIPSLFSGGEYSVSTWIYITSWEVNKGYNKPFLSLSGGGGDFKTTILYLGQNTPKLGIRTSTSVGGSTSSGISLTTAEQIKIRPTNGNGFGSSPYTDTGGDFKLCDVESVDMQRWVNITVVLSGRTQDVYIDGKMSRSCVLPSVFTVDGDSPQIILGGPYGFGGLIGTTRAANFAYSPDQVYKNYQNGPMDMSIWSKIKGYLDPSQFATSVKKMSSNVA